jgi:hypothetical protein
VFHEKGIGAKLRQWVNDAWGWLGSKFGIRGLSAEQIGELTLDKFVDGAVADIMKGKTIENERTKIADSKNYDFDVSGITEANAQEMQAIKAATQANGTFMQAPNGAATRLNERQWLQVRTGAFKEWFGEWEAAAKLQMIEDLAMIRIEPHQYNREQLEKIYKDTQNGKNKFDGKIVDFSHNVFGKMYRNENSMLGKVVPKLNAVFESFIPIYFEIEREREGHKEHPNLVGYHNYLGKAKIDEKDYYVRFTVQEQKIVNKEAVIKSGTPNQLHNSFVSDVNFYEVGNKRTGSILTDAATNGAKSTTRIMDAKLQQFFEKTKFAKQNSSKIVDENGEPMVVYHGTGDKFTAFDRSKLGSRENKFFFTSDRREAEMYGAGNVIPVFSIAKIW